MQFGDYQDIWTYHKQLVKRDPELRLKTNHWEDFYKAVLNDAMTRNNRMAFASADSELRWWKADRPYYNIWPVMLDTLLNFKIEKVPLSCVSTPRIPSLEVRFPKGSIQGVESVLVDVVQERDVTGFYFQVGTDIRRENGGQPTHRGVAVFPKGNDERTSVLLQKFSENESEARLLLPAIRCALSVVLMQDDPNAIEPDVLSSDRDKWVVGTEDERRKIEERATNRRGRVGFHVGRLCETSPHWRIPHLALFWTGKGRTNPKVQMRAGCIVKRKSLKEVPTGYRGQD